MKSIVYVGPFRDGVEIVDADLWAPRGKPVDVDDKLAKRLLEQPGNWQAKGKPAPGAGSADEVLARVEGDPAKAAAALTDERARRRPRKKLIAALEEIAGTTGEAADLTGIAGDPPADIGGETPGGPPADTAGGETSGTTDPDAAGGVTTDEGA